MDKYIFTYCLADDDNETPCGTYEVYAYSPSQAQDMFDDWQHDGDYKYNELKREIA
jgi:hypothetical protein